MVANWSGCLLLQQILNSSGWIWGGLSLGQTLPRCHLAAAGCVSAVSYSMYLSASPSEASKAFSGRAASGCYTQQLCLQSPQILHFLSLQLPFEMFPLHSWWRLTLCKWLDGIQKGSQSWWHARVSAAGAGWLALEVKVPYHFLGTMHTFVFYTRQKSSQKAPRTQWGNM